MTHLFRSRSARAVYEMHYGPNMTPMVDVVMVILIFFMASAALLGPEWFLKSSLPVVSQAASATTASNRLKLTIKRLEGRAVVSVDTAAGKPVQEIPISQLEQLLSSLASRQDLTALVSPEADVAYEDVVRVHEACARAGVPRIGLVDLPGGR